MPETRSLNTVLAENLGYFMERAGLSQAALAKRAQMGQTTVGLHLSPARRLQGKSGKEPSAKLAEVQRLAEALGVAPWELLRPLTESQREFYRSMEALIDERVAQSLALGSNARTSSSPGKQPRRAA